MEHPKADRENVQRIRPNTVVKWSVALKAAFERANKNGGQKCVRGVVAESKLLTLNPWKNFTWIDGTEPKKRHLNDEELLSLLDYFEQRWPTVVTVTLFAKISLWMWAEGPKRPVYAGKTCALWGMSITLTLSVSGASGNGRESLTALYQDLLKVRTDSPYVFAAYNEQLKRHYRQCPNPHTAKTIGPRFDPELLYRWFHIKMRKWAEETGRERASHHAFRKTALQTAR